MIIWGLILHISKLRNKYTETLNPYTRMTKTFYIFKFREILSVCDWQDEGVARPNSIVVQRRLTGKKRPDASVDLRRIQARVPGQPSQT